MLSYIIWNPDLIALHIGPLAIRWYALCWLTGFVAVYLIVQKLYKQQNMPDEKFEPLFLYSFVGIILGARLGHCIFYQPDYFLASAKGVFEMFIPVKLLATGVTDSLASGNWKFIGYEGLASHGGTLGLMIAIVTYSKRNKVPVLFTIDCVAIATPVMAALIRIGNLMNSEIIGKVTDVPWAFVFERVDMLPRHPGQLYEAIVYLLLLFIGFAVYKKHPERVGTGFYFGLCLTYIFTARFFIEFTKEIQEAFEASLPLDMGQLLSIPFVILGVVCMLRYKKR